MMIAVRDVDSGDALNFAPRLAIGGDRLYQFRRPALRSPSVQTSSQDGRRLENLDRPGRLPSRPPGTPTKAASLEAG
jgi:hypothetical protein